MSREFTHRAYADLLDAAVAAGFEFLTVREALAAETLPPRFLVVRHDVARKPANALEMARIEAERDVSGTYYVRSVERTFDPAVLERLADLGHEVGYCYEDLDRADGDRDLARRLFETHLARLREHVPVETVCPYENPLTPHDNADLLSAADLAALDLLGEPADLGRASGSGDGFEAPRFSDDGRTWRDGGPDGDGTPEDDLLDAATTRDLADLFARHRVSRARLCVHPCRWADSYPEFVATQARDAAVEAARRGLELLS